MLLSATRHLWRVTMQLGLQLAAEVQQLQAQNGADVAGLPILVSNSAQVVNTK